MGSLVGSIPDRAAELRAGQIWSSAGNAVDLPWTSPPPSASPSPSTSAGAPMDIQPRAVMQEIVPPAPPRATLAGKAASQSTASLPPPGRALGLTGHYAQRGLPAVSGERGGGDGFVVGRITGGC